MEKNGLMQKQKRFSYEPLQCYDFQLMGKLMRNIQAFFVKEVGRGVVDR